MMLDSKHIRLLSDARTSTNPIYWKTEELKSKDNFYVLLPHQPIIFAKFVPHLFRIVDLDCGTLVQVGLTYVDYLQEHKIMVNYLKDL